ncbi:MAG TPA: TIGR02678 family protein [Pirellulales bacterium]|jgi:uncharacterized protein (TIGR02678 family)|nr:TIGR02678 family protein [Pirellulales bacterium]
MAIDITEGMGANEVLSHSRAGRSLTAAARLRQAASESELVERQAALRALLRQPILPAVGETADDYRLVWRHAEALRLWLMRMTGWTLALHGELARLRKTPQVCEDVTRAARDANGQPLTRRRYALLCLLLAVLEGEDRQTTLSQVAERIALVAGGTERLRNLGFQFDLISQDCRRDLVCTIQLLVEVGVMSRDDGDDQEFIRGSGDALYRIHRPMLASMLCVSRGPSTLPPLEWPERLMTLHECDMPDSDEAQNRYLRHRLITRLLEQPVVYFDQLTERELAYLTNQRNYLLREIEAATGLVPEIRREGIALLDKIGDLSDISLPEAGTLGHATLLLAEWLAAKLRSAASDSAASAVGSGIEPTAVEERMVELAMEHREHWKRGVEQPSVRQAILREALDRLEALGLIEIRRGRIVPRPAIARYALENAA